ncbi:hypothetical protein [Methylobacterium platani]|uniref:Uncharacterized protein n=2 Tax=Methylobacterium platani TaxID=427683 RepID=A0A179SAK0_9HYPH|nr:hypothetical protein [Methylobacterium platani]KMO16015.1 hypothetical protein SQ03_15715 [Methylobacterium platani JCM 14648]OAS24849.1 hypothetical protein A5481_12195 [Methylobacterium platani]
MSALDDEDAMSQPQANLALLQLCDIAAGLLQHHRAGAGGRLSGPGSPSLRDALAFIEARLSDPDIGPKQARTHPDISRLGFYHLRGPTFAPRRASWVSSFWSRAKRRA